MRAALFLLGALALGCNRKRDVAASPTLLPDAPVLTRVSPDTIPLGKGAVPTLTLTGRGFAVAAGGNTLRVGRAVVDGLSADAAGAVIRTPLALTYTDTTVTGRPTGFRPGRYDVTVTTARGTSNALTLVMIP